jgi:hypothetical protein
MKRQMQVCLALKYGCSFASNSSRSDLRTAVFPKVLCVHQKLADVEARQ